MDTWIFNNNLVDTPPLNAVGFIYIITNLSNGKKYIGKKLLTMATYKQVNGKKKKARKESKWRQYQGSNKELLFDISINNHSIKKEIIEWSYTESQHNYLEVKYQFIYEVLEDINFYNDNINGRWYRKNIIQK
mgnify:FL=1